MVDVVKEIIPKPGLYECSPCEMIFRYTKGDLVCPNCGNKDETELVAIDVNTPREEDLMKTKDDFPGG